MLYCGEVSVPSAGQDCPEYDDPRETRPVGCVWTWLPKTVLLVERHPIAPLLEFAFDIVEMR